MAALNRAALPQGESDEARDLVQDTKAARVRQLMGEGLSLDEIAREVGLSEAEIRELMDEGRAV